MYEVYEEDYDESEYEYDYDGEDPDEEDDYFAETENGDGNDEGDGEEDDDRPKRKKEKDEEVRVAPYRFLRKACPVEKATIPGCNMNDTMQRHIENYLAEKKETSLNYFLSVSEPLINLEVSAFEVRYHVMGCFEDLKSAYLNGIMKALQKYDVKKEKVFFDYAKQYGETEMHDFVRTCYCRHSVPSKYQYKRLRDVMRFYREYGSRSDDEAIEKIAQAAEIPPEEALKYLLAGDRNNRFVDYYNMGPDPDEEDAYYSCEDLVGDYSWNPDTVFFATMRADAVMEAYDALTYREKEMVAMDLSFCSECLQPEMITNKKGEREPKPLHANSYVSIAEEFEMEDGNWAKHIIDGAYDKIRMQLLASEYFKN